MKIIGWIRYGDKAACGGMVVEGLSNFTSHGVMMSYEGAKVSCKKNCVIGESHSQHTLPNGRHQSHHGHRTIPGMCPLVSTLNDIHGRGNESGKHIPVEFIEHEGAWIEAIYDEQFVLMTDDGSVVSESPYSIRLEDGEIMHGVTGADGKTERYKTNGSKRIEIILGHI